MDKRVRSRGAPDGHRTVEKPVMADVYNEYMGGVDHFDQLMKPYQYPHRSYKWYMALYHYIREMCVVNAYVLAKEDGYVDNQKTFREELIDLLVRPQLRRKQAKAMKKPKLVPNRLEASRLGHFPKKSDQRLRCVLCSQNKKRSTSRFSCGRCGVSLCIDSCFEIFHTKKNPQNAWRNTHQ